jgi:diguanylate cyclase (GGDEF)-like protein
MRGEGILLPPLARRVAGLVALTLAYFVAAKLGLRYAFVNPSATAVWAPTGIALAAFLISGKRVWPAIFAGAFLANLTTAGTVLTSLGIAAGNTLEGWTGAWLLRRYGSGRETLQTPRGVLTFALLAAGVSTTVSATIGVVCLTLGGLLPGTEIGPVWLTWWLGDAGGDLVVAPAILAWSMRHDLHGKRRDAYEVGAMLAALALAAGIAFGGWFAPIAHSPLSFLCLPPLVWASYRFGRRGAATGVLVVAGIGIWGTLARLEASALQPNQALLVLQAYLAAISVTALTLAAVVGQRRSAESELRLMAVSDALTGIANYRRLLVVIEQECNRSDRTSRPFSILFLDLDGLKRINDQHGHQAGNRALWRVAEALRNTSRAIDTPARYGGDEFALVLPEADEVEARKVSQRVTDFLAADGEQPPVTVSVGVAESPRDGTTASDLLATADRDQYAVKTRRPDLLRNPVHELVPEAALDAEVAVGGRVLER